MGFLCFLGAFNVAIIAKYSHYPCQLGLLPSYQHEPPKEIFQNYLQYTNNIGLPIMTNAVLMMSFKVLALKQVPGSVNSLQANLWRSP